MSTAGTSWPASTAAETLNVHVFRMRDGVVLESWDASTDQYTLDEVLG